MTIAGDPPEDAAAEARVYRDQHGGLWIDPWGDGRMLAFDSQARRAMTGKWGLVPAELVHEKFALAELLPVAVSSTDWAVRWLPHRGRRRLYEARTKAQAVITRDGLLSGGYEAAVMQRRSAVTVPAGEWTEAEDVT